jgi:hypothetical protein
MSLSARLADWTDWDAAAFSLDRELGIFASDGDWLTVKHVFWTDNQLGRGWRTHHCACTSWRAGESGGTRPTVPMGRSQPLNGP